MTKSSQEKIQELELTTVKAVTALQKDVQQLSNEVSKLAEQIQKMTENYVTKEEYILRMTEFDAKLAKAQRVGFIKTLLTGVVTTTVTAIVMFELMEILNK